MSDTTPTALPDPARERLLGTLLAELDARRRKRRAVRIGSSVSLCGVAVLGVWWLISPAPSGTQRAEPTNLAGPAALDPAPAPVPAAFRIEHVANHEPAHIQFITGQRPRLAVLIDDDQLLATLNTTTDCYGLSRIGSRVLLLDRCTP